MRYAFAVGFTVLLAVCSLTHARGHGGDARVVEAQAAPVPAHFVQGWWNGRWMDEHRRGSGSVEVILTPGTGPGEVMAQFTFLVGGDARSARRLGTVTGDALRFDLVGGGEIVLRPVGREELAGEFRDPGGQLPVRRGYLELSRAP